MTVQYRSKTFKSGNSVAVRLPKAIALPEGVEVEIEQSARGDIAIRRVYNPEEVRRANRQMVEDMRKIGFPPEIQQREAFEAPERPGL